MGEHQQLTAAPEPIVLGGREFRLSPLTDRDIAELDSWVRSQCITIARSSLPPDADQVTRDETLRIAMSLAMSLTWMSGEGAKIVATVDGMSRLMWQMARREHPALTHDELRSYMMDPENISAFREKFKSVNAGPKLKNESAPGRPGQKRKK